MPAAPPLYGVTGSRSLNGERDGKKAFAALDRAWDALGPFRLAQGDCPEGGDRWARLWCQERGVEQVPFPPDNFSTAAFFKRNRALVEASVGILALWDGTLSKGGTIYTMRHAHKRRRPVYDLLAPSGPWERAAWAEATPLPARNATEHDTKPDSAF